jgi:hypothetical protein
VSGNDCLAPWRASCIRPRGEMWKAARSSAAVPRHRATKRCCITVHRACFGFLSRGRSVRLRSAHACAEHSLPQWCCINVLHRGAADVRSNTVAAIRSTLLAAAHCNGTGHRTHAASRNGCVKPSPCPPCICIQSASQAVAIFTSCGIRLCRDSGRPQSMFQAWQWKEIAHAAPICAQLRSSAFIGAA